jgi:putative transposase
MAVWHIVGVVDETVRYTYRLRPGARAEHALLCEWGRCRWLWNEAVHQRKSGNRPTFCGLSKLLTAARAKSAWLREGSQVAQQQTLRTYSQALTQSFTVKVRGRPRPKRLRDSRPALEYTRRGFAIRDGRLRLAGGITLPVVWSRELPSPPSSVRVYQDSLGHWYASFVVTREITPAPDAGGGIGVDWGVTTTATTTDPAFDLPHLSHRKRCAAELARAQRKLARRRRPRGHAQSNGYRRAARQAARLHKKAARQTTHDARVWANRVAANHQLIAVEDFKPKFLAKSTMARKAADAAIGATKRILVEAGERAGRRVVLVPPTYTTMTCAQCGTRAKDRLGLGQRVFRCDHCGNVDGRDRNAARVILALAERGHAGADDVRHSVPSPRGGRSDAVRARNPLPSGMGKR